MKSIWLTACGGGAGRVRFQGAKKRPVKGKELNDLVANAVKSVFTTSTRKQAKDLSDLAQKTIRITSTLERSRLGVNENQPARR